MVASCFQRCRTGGGTVMYRPGVQGTKNNGKDWQSWAGPRGGACNSVLSALAGLRDPSRAGGNGCSALHRPDWSCWDRPAAHQPVSLFLTSPLCQTSVHSWKQESSKDREASGLLFSSSQLPPGSLRSSSLVPAEDQLQRTHFHDSRHQSHLPVAAVGLRQSQVGPDGLQEAAWTPGTGLLLLQGS